MQTMKKRIGRIGGWHPSTPDHNDIPYALPLDLPGTLPATVDNRGFCHPVRDQENAGACTGFSSTGMLAYDRNRQGLDPFPYSELYIYYKTRLAEGTEDSDAGATNRDTIKTALKIGVCSEALWPYDTTKVTEDPPTACDASAILHRAVQYQRITHSLHLMQSVLYKQNTFIAGIGVYPSFESNAVAQSGMVPMPKKGEHLLGGHSILVCGYADDKQVFICQNSWGVTWGDHGFFYLPYAYLISSKYSDDFWCIQTVQ